MPDDNENTLDDDAPENGHQLSCANNDDGGDDGYDHDADKTHAENASERCGVRFG